MRNAVFYFSKAERVFNANIVQHHVLTQPVGLKVSCMKHQVQQGKWQYKISITLSVEGK
jgi:hypothetical protein